MALNKFLIIFFLAMCIGNTFGLEESDVPLVLDQRNAPVLPSHFRISKMTSNKKLDWKGFNGLHITGGAQFSKLELEKILELLQVKKITIIDLRQESHGFLNGNAISWYGPHNASNAARNPHQIEWEQANLLSKLAESKELTVLKILKKTDDECVLKTKPIQFAVHQISSEKDFAADHNLDYFRIYAQDFHAPSSPEVDRFIQVTKVLPENQWIYFHCRAGIGRSTTFMVMYDMVHNAKHVSFRNILSRHVAIGGKDLSDFPDAHSYKYPFAVKRYLFLKMFYQYARKNNDHFKTTWSEWLATQKINSKDK